MKIGVSEPEQCGCDTCVQHRTLCTQETEPSKEVTGSSVPVSSEPVQRLGSTSDQSSGTEETPLAPPEPAAQSVDASSTSSSIFSSVSSQPARALCPTGSLPVPLFGCSWPRPCSCTGCSLLGPSIRRSSPFFTASSGSSISSSRQGNVTNSFGPAASEPSVSGPMKAPIFTSGSSTASTSSTLPSLVTPSDITRGSVQAPVQANTSKTASDFHPPNVANTGVCAASRTSTNNPFPGFSVDYLPRCHLFGPNAPTTTPVPGPSSVLAGGETEQGSRYPRYAPTPDVDGKQIISISASNSHGHKSHEELRWEDYKNGDKGGVGRFHPAHKPRKESRWDKEKNGDKAVVGSFPPPDHTPSVFTPPSIPERPRMRTIDLTNRDTNGFPIGYNTPAAFQSPHEHVGVSSPASGCTACGATSSSSPSSHLGLNGTTNLPSAATSLPGLFFSTYGSFPLLFGSPNLAAYGTTATPAVQAYPMMFVTPSSTSQGTTATPAFQAFPMMFGIPNLAAQGTTATPSVQAYPMMFGIPNLAAQGTTTTTSAAQPYPMMFGIPNLAAQGTTTTTSAAQPYPMMFGTPSLAAQGTTTAVQPYPTMYGTPNFGAQGMTPAAQAYPVNGLTLLPFAAMSLQ